MAVVLGSYTFDDACTSVVEEHEEVGGRDARIIHLKGTLDGFASLALLEAELDMIVQAASEDGEATALLLRAERRLWVRRTGFTREIVREARVGRFTLVLEARDPCEEAVPLTSEGWVITASGATKALSTSGNVFALPTITLVATGTVVDPSFGDGTRTVAYAGDVADGETLVFDGAAGRVTLEGEDVTPYATGLFPRVDPAGTTFTYTDDEDSSHTAWVTVAHRARWW